MKKLTLAFFTTCAITSSLSAQYRENHDLLDKLVWNEEKLNILLDTRFDGIVMDNDGSVDAVSFNGQTLRVWFTGEVVPGIRYRVRQRFNKPQRPTERDNLSGATDQAWIAFDLGKHWSITAGKQAIQLGTFESNYSGADVYLGSMICNDFDTYQLGVDAAWNFRGQTLHVQVINSGSEQFAAPEYQNKAFGGALLWEGSLWDGVVKTRWGYSAFQHTRNKFHQWITVGTQLNAGGFKTELDYYLGDRMMDYSSTVSVLPAASRRVSDRSASVNVEHTFGKWRPFIKAVWSERYDDDLASAAYETRGIQAVAEYYPFLREELKDLRFHAAWMYSRTDFRGLFADLASTSNYAFLVGMRWLFKVK
jgi:hypothetical protein